MNRLEGMRTYLVGAMDRVKDGGVEWRELITPWLKGMGVVVLNPCDKPIDVGIEDENTRGDIEYLKSTGQFDKVKEKYSVIRTLDLRCVDISDFIIASIDTDVHACGTYEEITTANRQKKPILIWCKQGKRHAPNWLFMMLPHEHIFDTLSDLQLYLEYVDVNEDIEHYKRWFFLDQSKLKARC
jgi:hypothetical protein